MKRLTFLLTLFIFVITIGALAASADWVTRDHRWQLRGPWNWALSRELPELYREFNGIDYGHARIAETLISTQDPEKVEQARLDVLKFIFSSPAVAPDEAQIAPTYSRLAWEIQKTFNWTHILHRSLYDLFASDKVKDKEAAYKKILADYLSKPEAITPMRLDHHNKLWSFPESKAFRDKFPKFNSQIWAYHWLQAAVTDVQLMGDAAKQKELMPKIIAHYHEYLKNPPVDWQFMPMFSDVAPGFNKRFPEAAAIFDNLHMLHDNFDDILSRPDLYPTLQAKREAILKILPIYLNRSHMSGKYMQYMEMPKGAGHGGHEMMDMGKRPPSAEEVLFGKASDDMKQEHEGHHHMQTPKSDTPKKTPAPEKKTDEHQHHH